LRLKPESLAHPPVELPAGAEVQHTFADLEAGSTYEVEAVAIVEQGGTLVESVASSKAITTKVCHTQAAAMPNGGVCMCSCSQQSAIEIAAPHLNHSQPLCYLHRHPIPSSLQATIKKPPMAALHLAQCHNHHSAYTTTTPALMMLAQGV
jgi:hypothetical protein